MSPEEYDDIVEAYRDKYGYDDMSDEEKEAFDSRLDKVLEKDDSSEDPDAPEDPDELRSAMEKKYGYDEMSDEEKERFDKAYDEVMAGDGEQVDESEDIDSRDEVDAGDEDEFRNEMKDKFGYDDMSDEEKERFDKAYDELMSENDSDEGEDPEEPEKVLRRTR